MSARSLTDSGVDDCAFKLSVLPNRNSFLELRNVEFFVFNFSVLWDAERLFGFPTLELGELCLLGKEPIESRIQVSECALE
jgi:hypothetical protein